jgi:hypothetical protein
MIIAIAITISPLVFVDSMFINPVLGEGGVARQLLDLAK